MSNFDIFSEVGCAASTTDPNTSPIVKSFTVTISDGTLDISLPATKDNGQISAIELLFSLPTDNDMDGFSPPADCDDNDDTVFPGAPELCDGKDNDCDGPIDEGLGQTTCGVGGCEVTVNNCEGGLPQTCTPGTPSALPPRYTGGEKCN